MIQGIGDVAVLVNLAVSVAQKLDRAVHKAPAEILDLKDDAQALELALKRVLAILREEGSLLRPHDDTKAALGAQFRRCGGLLEDLKKIVAEYEVVIVTNDGAPVGDEATQRKAWLAASKKACQDAFLRLKWTTMDKVVSYFHNQLNEQLAVLNVTITCLQT